MAIEVDTKQYEFAHGHKPRGSGTWAFFFDKCDDVRDAQWFNGKFADAKKAAMAYAAKFKYRRIVVGS